MIRLWIALLLAIPSTTFAQPGSYALAARGNLCRAKRDACNQQRSAPITDRHDKAVAQLGCFREFYLISAACKFTDVEVRAEAIRIHKAFVDSGIRKLMITACMAAIRPPASRDNASFAEAKSRCEKQVKPPTREDLVRFMPLHEAYADLDYRFRAEWNKCFERKDGKQRPREEVDRCVHETELFQPTAEALSTLVKEVDEARKMDTYRRYAMNLCYVANGAKTTGTQAIAEKCRQEEQSGVRLTPNQIKIYDSMRDAIEAISNVNPPKGCFFRENSVVLWVAGKPVPPRFEEDTAVCEDNPRDREEAAYNFNTSATQAQIATYRKRKQLDREERVCRDAALKTPDIVAARTDCALKFEVERMNAGVIPAYLRLSTFEDYRQYIVAGGRN
jgi:hypothetical protein